MNGWHQVKRLICMAAILGLSTSSFLTERDGVHATTVSPYGYMADCFCNQIDSGQLFFALARVEAEHDPESMKLLRHDLVIIRAIGPHSPAINTRIPILRDTVTWTPSPSVGPEHYCYQFPPFEFEPVAPTPIICAGIEDMSSVPFLGHPTNAGIGGRPYEQLCKQPREINKILDFFESIELDRGRCRREIVDALGLVEPFKPLPTEPEGCNGGNPLGLLWPTAGLVLLARRRRTPPPV